MTMRTIPSLIVAAGCLATASVIGLASRVDSDADSAGGVVSTVKASKEDEGDRSRCSKRTVKGPYAFGLVGSVIGIGPISASGTTTFDGEGSATIKAFINTATGAPAIETSLEGTYTVNKDCTGSATFDVPSPGLFGLFTLRFKAVIVNRGEEIRYLITTPGVVFAGASVRQFP